MTPHLSVLDLAYVPDGADAGAALRRSAELARHAEALGYKRFWVAEHHNMPGIASAATAVVVGYVAGATTSIRVGAGGVMLPNHSPLVVAEQFGTLDALYPGRIDLGLGRAPGTDQLTWRAMRRDPRASDRFPQDVMEVLALVGPDAEPRAVRAFPGVGSNVPVWILGSSLFGAQLAAALGLPFAFASHFAPDALLQALAVYRAQFEPSIYLDRPYAMAGVQVVAARSDDEARRLFTSQQQSFVNRRRGARGKLPPPIDDIETYWNSVEKAEAMHAQAYAFVGAGETVARKLTAFAKETAIDEIMVAGAIYDQAARLASYEILARVMSETRVESLEAAT